MLQRPTRTGVLEEDRLGGAGPATPAEESLLRHATGARQFPFLARPAAGRRCVTSLLCGVAVGSAAQTDGYLLKYVESTGMAEKESVFKVHGPKCLKPVKNKAIK